ncbi:conserved membrane protein of unknown function [Rhodovastum atsumiense]|uniref:Glycosyltransferase RgtA/B/C/D-like domain-containing protein n=1 Tax=Rhodovastum atsumiense TaxID=504468 RepID=A0A5M6IS64_9PROT|nr:hypothetical protein [Rhodovastum atsumiense]KAA5611144.1 hypothetical protein F1189_16270 [Rhodovastum atsumiense]CAH2599217.1 conserved membrane protein of unknown function [Rhodovastum atsumiense]
MPSDINGMPPAALRRRLDLPGLVSMAILLGALLLVLITATGSPQKDDVAWLLYVARKWLGGQRLYDDIIEVNPPLIVWLYALPAQVSVWTGLAPKTVSAPFFAAILMGCAWWTATLLKGQAALFARRLPVFGAIGTVLLLLPGVEFGQREHLLVATALPYLALFARERAGTGVSARQAALIGAVAALGCALKPSYVVAFAALEAMGRLHGLRLLRPAPLAAAATLALYGLVVLTVCPAFLEKAVPLALALYGGTDTPMWDLLTEGRLLMAGVAVLTMLALLARPILPKGEALPRHLLVAAAVFATAATLSYLLQGKDWFYHRLPATTVTILALLAWSAAMLGQRPWASRRHLLRVAVPATLALSMLAWFGQDNYQRMERWITAAVEPDLSTEVRLERLVKREHAKTYIAFSEWIALGFPVVNDTGVTWASRFDSMWALKGELWRARQDGAAPQAWPIRRWIARDFVANCPDLAVVDTREGINYVAVLSASDPDFAEAWSRYRQIASFDGLRVLRRDEAGCVPTPRPGRARMTATAMEPP